MRKGRARAASIGQLCSVSRAASASVPGALVPPDVPELHANYHRAVIGPRTLTSTALTSPVPAQARIPAR